MSCSASVAHTASDALNSKLSCLAAGYEPVSPNNALYSTLLRRVSAGLSHHPVGTAQSGGGGDGKKKAVRRQTPLVNAGYAARLSAVSDVTGRFVTALDTGSTGENSEEQQRINVVLLGCGMDALGLWAHGISKELSLVRVYELDCEENSAAKREALVRSGIVVASTSEIAQDDGEGSTILRGRINLLECSTDAVIGDGTKESADVQSPRCPNGDHYHDENYTLLSSDLRDLSSVRRAILNSTFDPSHRTIVVSELVLTYLGHRGSDALLEYISSELCAAPRSLFLAYETIGPSNGGFVGQPSVTGAYAADYCNTFSSKLNRGRHDHDDSSAEPNNTGSSKEREGSFRPLGEDCSAALSRCSGLRGFGGPTGCCLAGYAAAAAAAATGGGAMTAKEIFDEHAALALHLRCYVVLCAFSPGSERSYVDRVCPWFRSRTTLTCNDKECDIQTSFSCGGGGGGTTTATNIRISPIQSVDQEQVRSLFKSIYANLFDEYPSVKKMVKTALKTDLSGKQQQQQQQQQQHQEGCNDAGGASAQNKSAIKERYCSSGGGFWVATVDTRDCEEKGRDQSGSGERKVVGCIGVRPSTIREVSKGENSIDPNAFEIHRFAVADESRGKGVGRALLELAEKFLTRRSKSKSDENDASYYSLLANTPAVLEGANHFYRSCGFDLQGEAVVGKMVMMSYKKRI